ncbi:unnamed protein product [Rotaria sp. Silwood2]|nr:unnamed protein product [Rotaria sp. Silwood2]CAF3018074.1 unnamed protein product [Rotaria sp. Silwood2]
MCKQIIRQLFSSKCQLTCLRLNMINDSSDYRIHESFSPYYDIYSSEIDNQLNTNCMTLRYLYIKIVFGYFIEYVIEHVPALEILSITFKYSLIREFLHQMRMIQFVPTISNWNDKVK